MVKGGTEYKALHRWVQKSLGRAEVCSTCFRTSEETRIEWANLSGKYTKDLEDWLPMCRTCHMIFDDVSQRVWETRRKRYGDTGHKPETSWKGWKHSSESKKRMSKQRKGKKFNEEHKRNLSKSLKNAWAKGKFKKRTV